MNSLWEWCSTCCLHAASVGESSLKNKSVHDALQRVSHKSMDNAAQEAISTPAPGKTVFVFVKKYLHFPLFTFTYCCRFLSFSEPVAPAEEKELTQEAFDLALRRSGVEIAEDPSLPVAVSSKKSFQSQKSAAQSQKTLGSGQGQASATGSQKKSVNSISSAKKSVPSSEKGSQTAGSTHGSRLSSAPGSVAGGSNKSLRQEKGIQVRSKEGSLHSQYTEADPVSQQNSRAAASPQSSTITLYEDKGTQVYLSNDQLFSVPGSQREPIEVSQKSLTPQPSATAGSAKLSQAGSQTAGSIHASQAGSKAGSALGSKAGSAAGSKAGSAAGSKAGSAVGSATGSKTINGGEFADDDTCTFFDREIQVREKDGVLYSDYSEEGVKSVLEETDIAATEVTNGSVKSAVRSEMSVPSNERGVQVRTVDGMLQSMSETGKKSSGAIYTDAAEVEQIGSQPDVKPVENGDAPEGEGSAAASKTGIELLEDEGRVLLEDKGIQVYFRDWVLVSQTSSYRSGSLLASPKASRTSQQGSIAAKGSQQSAHASRAASQAGSAHPSRKASANGGSASRQGSINAGSAHPSRAASVNASQAGSAAAVEAAPAEAEAAPAEAEAEAPAAEEPPAEGEAAAEGEGEAAAPEAAPEEGAAAAEGEVVEEGGQPSQAALGSGQASATMAAASSHASKQLSQASRAGSVAASAAGSKAVVAEGEANPYDGLAVEEPAADAAPTGETTASGEITEAPGEGMIGSVHENADMSPVGSATGQEEGEPDGSAGTC